MQWVALSLVLLLTEVVAVELLPKVVVEGAPLWQSEMRAGQQAQIALVVDHLEEGHLAGRSAASPWAGACLHHHRHLHAPVSLPSNHRVSRLRRHHHHQNRRHHRHHLRVPGSPTSSPRDHHHHRRRALALVEVVLLQRCRHRHRHHVEVEGGQSWAAEVASTQSSLKAVMEPCLATVGALQV
jgi:hypothetical protein